MFFGYGVESLKLFGTFDQKVHDSDIYSLNRSAQPAVLTRGSSDIAGEFLPCRILLSIRNDLKSRYFTRPLEDGGDHEAL
jgi:hypothetical protein